MGGVEHLYRATIKLDDKALLRVNADVIAVLEGAIADVGIIKDGKKISFFLTTIIVYCRILCRSFRKKRGLCVRG